MSRHAMNMIEHTACEPAGYEVLRASLNILLVEDEASDTMLAEIALDDTHLPYEIHTLQDGQEVLPYLRHQGKYRNAIRPDVLILDLSLPTKDGFEVLTELAEHSEQFEGLAIIILTADTHCTFLRQSYGLHIAAYLTKPCTAPKIRGALAAIENR